MAVKSVSAKAWNIAASVDGRFYSAYPAGDAPVSPPGEYVGAGQLAAGEYAPSRMAMTVMNPRPSSELTSKSRYNWAHSQFQYAVKVTVMGGAPPFKARLTGSPPVGAAITAKTPPNNPFLYTHFEVTLPANTGGAFGIEIVDQEGTAVATDLDVTVSDANFRFVDPVAGSDEADGSYATPWASEANFMAGGYSDKIIVWADGLTPASFSLGDVYPVSHIRMPGATPVINCANVVIDTSAAIDDLYWGEIGTSGSRSDLPNTRVFRFSKTGSRWTIDAPSFDSPVSGTSGSDNESCMWFDEVAARSCVSIINPTYSNLPPSSNGLSMFDLFAIGSGVIIGGTGTDINSKYAAWAKGSCDQLCMWGTSVYEGDSLVDPGMGLIAKNDQSGSAALIQMAYCRSFKNDDNTLNSVCALRLGDTNSEWGTVYCDRLTIVGDIQVEGGASGLAGGTPYITDSVLISASITPDIVMSGNITSYARADVADQLNADGSMKTTGSLYASYYGTKGADVKEAA